MRVLVVDDEPLARDRLVRLLGELDFVNAIKSAGSGVECLEKLNSFAADVVLLDIRMPGESGLDVALAVNQRPTPPAIIFCTAFDDYALDAFRVKAQGYLVKPVTRQALTDALAHCQQFTRAHLQALGYQPDADVIAVQSGREKELIPLVEVHFLRAEQKYVSLFCERGERVLDDSLKTLEERFAAHLLRVHRNTLVYRPRLQRLQRDKEGGYWVVLKDVATPLAVSRRHAKDVKRCFE